MEGVYDHIAESQLPSSDETAKSPTESEGNLNEDLAEAYKTFTASPWGARIGGFLGSVRKQGETALETARKQGESVYAEVSAEAALAGQDALKGFTDLRESLVQRARSMSSGENSRPAGEGASGARDREGKSGDEDESGDVDKAVEEGGSGEADDGFISKFRAEAEKRLRDIQRAEDAADEALLKFGANIRNFLRDAVTVSAPAEDGDSGTAAGEGGKVMFESKDAEGRKVIHTSRFDAQLHVIHCSLDSFSRDPASAEFAGWAEGFDINGKTDDIAADLTKYDELARAMEKLVPEQVPYEAFWKRYYFLRMVVESEEKRRREMLQGAAAFDPAAGAPGWEDDSEDDAPSTPQPGASTTTLTQKPSAKATDAGKPSAEPVTSPTETMDSLKPAEPRKSQDQGSSAGSDASYDIVSGATSHAASSPKEEGKPKGAGKKDESDEEDWE